MLTCHHSRRFAERPSITGFDPKKFAASAGNVKGDPWHR
jgi:NADH dehydrogenase (ubiquinone) 1 beta subcomplex subunit 3